MKFYWLMGVGGRSTSPCQIMSKWNPLWWHGNFSILQNGGRPPSWIFKDWVFFLSLRVRKANMRQCSKFHQNQSKCFWDISIFQFFNMAICHLGFVWGPAGPPTNSTWGSSCAVMDVKLTGYVATWSDKNGNETVAGAASEAFHCIIIMPQFNCHQHGYNISPHVCCVGLSSRCDSGVSTLNSEVSSSTSSSLLAHDKSFLSSSAPIDSFIQFEDDAANDDDVDMKV